MPSGKYDRYFGGKKGSAAKAKAAMFEEYGEEKGEHVFFATKNKRKGVTAGEASRAMRHRKRG